jgi:hypothetical protein
MERAFPRECKDLEYDDECVDADVEHAQDGDNLTSASTACTAYGERGYGSDYHASVFIDIDGYSNA